MGKPNKAKEIVQALKELAGGTSQRGKGGRAHRDTSGRQESDAPAFPRCRKKQRAGMAETVNEAGKGRGKRICKFIGPNWPSFDI
jgi:hypothetical protein